MLPVSTDCVICLSALWVRADLRPSSSQLSGATQDAKSWPLRLLSCCLQALLPRQWLLRVLAGRGQQADHSVRDMRCRVPHLLPAATPARHSRWWVGQPCYGSALVLRVMLGSRCLLVRVVLASGGHAS